MKISFKPSILKDFIKVPKLSAPFDPPVWIPTRIFLNSLYLSFINIGDPL